MWTSISDSIMQLEGECGQEKEDFVNLNEKMWFDEEVETQECWVRALVFCHHCKSYDFLF